MKEFLTRPIAHRGVHNNSSIVENTIQSFQEAIKNKFVIECDVVLSKDGEVIVFHDNNLKRLANIDLNISEITSQELKKIKLLNTDSHISTLDEVLYAINSKTPLMIEIKSGYTPIIEERILEIIRSYSGSISVKSFDLNSISWFKKNAPYIKYGLVGSNLDININYLKDLGINFLSYDINFIDDSIVNAAKENGIPVIAWTIDNENKYKMGLKKADNIIFEKIKIQS